VDDDLLELDLFPLFRTRGMETKETKGTNTNSPNLRVVGVGGARPKSCHLFFASIPLTNRAILCSRQSLRKETHVATTARQHAGETEVMILARILGNERGQLPRDLARYILGLGFSDRDKARMHDLVVRNQSDALTPAEKEELFAFGKAGDLLAILKSKSRRVLGVKPKKRTAS
jgi:hypothetical protein